MFAIRLYMTFLKHIERQKTHGNLMYVDIFKDTHFCVYYKCKKKTKWYNNLYVSLFYLYIYIYNNII